MPRHDGVAVNEIAESGSIMLGGSDARIRYSLRSAGARFVGEIKAEWSGEVRLVSAGSYDALSRYILATAYRMLWRAGRDLEVMDGGQ